jgi:hypothetical protein
MEKLKLKTKNSLTSLLSSKKVRHAYYNKVNSFRFITRPLYILKLNSQKFSVFNGEPKNNLKDKYSFFNGVEYRKGILRKFSRVNSLRFYKKYIFKATEHKLD